jgi:acyl-CoA synthetase (AMP-forming)/AMP-acid ligase II
MEMLARAGGAAQWLTSIGAAEGAPVPALLASSPTALALLVGGGLTGRPLAPLGVRLATEELVALVRGQAASHLVAEPETAAIASVVAEAAGVRLDVLDEVPRGDLAPLPADADAVVLVLHTSGTTGLPKPVPIRDRPLWHRGAAYGDVLGFNPGDVYATAAPVHHSAGAGMWLSALTRGTGVVAAGSFSVSGWPALAALRPTHAFLVPTMITLLLESGQLGAAAFSALQYGAAPTSPALVDRMVAALPGVRLVQAYGQTEGGPLACLAHSDHLRALAGEPHLLETVGRAVPGVELRIDEPADDGAGEVVVRGGPVFLPDADGWLRTGDLGVIDASGYLSLSGRRGDKIIRGGENIYPVEVERVLADHPGVAEVTVLGVPDARWGEVVAAVIVPAPGGDPPARDALAVYAASRLAAYKVPTLWEYAETLPLTASGKVRRSELRSAFAPSPH